MDIFIRRFQSNPWLRIPLAGFLFVFTGFVIGMMVLDFSNLRLMLFTACTIGMIAISQRYPVWILFLLSLYLPLMGFIRRILIPVAGWSDTDPLVLVPHFMIILMAFSWYFNVYIKREPITDDTKLFRMVRWLIVIEAIQIINPYQGGLFVGFGGIIFYMVPLFWMVLGRTFLNERNLKRLVGMVFVIGIVSALYGLKQIFFGFFPFEIAWIQIAGYAALMLAVDVYRGFSFFTNAAEYVLYLEIAIIIAWVFALKGNWRQRALCWGILLPLLWYALFMESNRTSIVFTSIASALVAIVQAKPGKPRWAVTGITVVLLVLVYLGITAISHNGDPVFAHLVEGLADPMNTEKSTASLHLTMVIDGLMYGITHPWGLGLGISTLAGSKTTGLNFNTEYDISNIVVSTGLIGGILYLLIYIKVFRLAYSYTQTGNKLSLIIYGSLCALGGLWLMGGNYSTCALIWLFIGFLDTVSKNHRVNKPKDRQGDLQSR